MGRKKLTLAEKKNRKNKDLDSAVAIPKINFKEETKHGALAIVCLALAVFFILSSFQEAGRAGNFSYEIFSELFGAGFYLIPLVFFSLAFSFFKSMRPNFVISRLIGGLVFFISNLAMVSILFEEKTGGAVGSLLAKPMLSFFDFYISLVFLIAIDIVSLLIIFDTGFSWNIFGLFKKKDGELMEEKLTPKEETQIPETLKNELANRNGSMSEKIIEPKKNNDDGFFSSAMSFAKRGSANTFVPPPLSLLERDSGKPIVGDIKANMNIIKRTLSNFGINVEMDEVSIGPSVTRYALKPAEGMKLSRIIALQNDLSLALAAHPLRIEAPIPGKSLVGIEIPNTTKATVGLATMLGTKDFIESNHPLFIALGKGISGLPQYTNLAKSPHMLIAGATGSGKSVTIHTIITSLLYRNSPEQLRFIMIDPKRVELTLYNKIPHLLTPVITEAKKTIAALRWAAKEMDRRYDILEAESVRDIQSYHKNVLEPKLAKLNKKNNDSDETEEIERMPYIVIVIDELADIMTSYPRELEAAIVRLAQMSRAVGIHLILSTQRPSVEVITGLIKANIPSRIALQVASQIDSRTIIDMAGAEKLLGAGDMLYLGSEMAKPIRVQSAFITESEVKKVVSYLAEQYAGEFLPSEISLGNDEVAGNKALFGTALGESDNDDDLYEDAKQAVIEAGKASASYLQRKLKVGYARAARLLDMLEERGIIGPGDGAKPREVYSGQTTVNNNSEPIENSEMI